jgi:hypothetical protein
MNKDIYNIDYIDDFNNMDDIDDFNNMDDIDDFNNIDDIDDFNNINYVDNIDNIDNLNNKVIIKFCVFVGREKNLKILHLYIEKALENNIFNEYHMFDFSRNKNDSIFILKEYERLNEIYLGKIFIHNHENNLLNIKNNNKKTNWNPFYKRIYEISSEDDIIIKCDDDILFIDLNGIKRAIDDRKLDKESFLIHSNCINNGVCAYYHRNAFLKLSDKLNEYPEGGILGILFEKPEIAYGMHMDFLNEIEKSYDKNIIKYYIEDTFINTRISINFILINGCDLKYMKDVTYQDEYELSSFLPEKLGRVNKIKGDFITAHYSYSFQEKIMFHKDDIYKRYCNLSKNIDVDIDAVSDSVTKIKDFKYNRPTLHKMNDKLYKVKNWIRNNSYYIKNADNNKYLYIDYEKDDVIISDKYKTIFEINSILEKNKETAMFEIKLGIYYITKYNVLGKFKNESILARMIQDKNERILIKEDYDKINNSSYIKFKKYNSYISLSERNIDYIDVTLKRQTKWIFEKIINEEEYIIAERIEKNNKFYYKNVNDLSENYYTNFYLGWGLEGCVW